MREYLVTMPFTGVATKVVHAETEDEAIEKALEDSTFPIGAPDDKEDVEIIEIELHRQIIKGNVFYGQQNEIDVNDYGEVE